MLYLRATALLALLGACADSEPRPESEVYEAVLEAALFSVWGIDTVRFVPQRPQALILIDSIGHIPRGWPEDMRPWLQERMPSLPSEIVEAYVLDTIPRRPAPPAIRTPVPTARLSNPFGPSGEPLTGEVIELGHIFFGRDSTALIQLSRWGPGIYDSWGFLFQLRRINGSWQVVDYFQSWES
jgi:hypothetical protein